MTKQAYERPVIKKLNSGFMNKFGTRTEFTAITDIEGIPVTSLIEKYGSPVFILSESVIRKKYHSAVRAFKTRYPKVQFAWSYKTNYLDAVCRIYHQEGSWAEVVSGFEYQKALRNGIDGSKIIFNGPDKTDDDLILAVKNKSKIHIDHFDELYRLIELADALPNRPQVAIRINMDTGIYPIWDRFGFNYESGQAWDAINKISASGKLDLVGLHCHIGTYIMAPWAYGTAAAKMAGLAKSVNDKFRIKLQYIDMGGGFASSNTLHGAYLPGYDTAPSFNDYAEAIVTSIFQAGFLPDELPLLILETGRALIDEAGFLLGTVLANKRLSDGRRATIVDVGVNILFTSFWYSHKISPAQEFSHYTEDTAIYGPLCMNIDVLRESINLPPMQKGDHFIIHTVGAYNMTQWLQFITMRPNIVLIDEGGMPHIIRKSETIDSITNLESIPQHLKEM